MQQTDTGLTARDTRVRELLVAYQGVIDTARNLPSLPMVLFRHGGRGPLGRFRYLPRPRWLLRYFVVRHIDRLLTSLSRRYSARAALGWAADDERQDRAAVQEFQQSLPPPRVKTYLGLLIIATVVIGRPITDLVVTWAVQLTQELPGSELPRRARETLEALTTVVTAEFPSVNRAVTVLLNAGLEQMALLALGLALSLYVVLRPCVPAFRLKRMLFSLAPGPDGQQRSAVASWSVSHATGIYERERRLFEDLGGRPPREFPFDLVVPGLAMLAPLAWGGVLFGLGVTEPEPGGRSLRLLAATTLLIPALLRLGWLYRTWRRRQSGHTGPYMPFEVRIRGGNAVARVERPIGVRLLVFLLLLLFAWGGEAADPEMKATVVGAFGAAIGFALAVSLLVSVPWWFRVSRELRDLDRSYGTPEPGRRRVMVRLGMILGWLAAIPVFAWIDDRLPLDVPLLTLGWLILLPASIAVLRTGRRIRRAQSRVGQRQSPRSLWMLPPGLLLHPLLFAYLQHRLNKLWAVEGEPLDPMPARTSGNAEPAAWALPWLRRVPSPRALKARAAEPAPTPHDDDSRPLPEEAERHDLSPAE